MEPSALTALLVRARCCSHRESRLRGGEGDGEVGKGDRRCSGLGRWRSLILRAGFALRMETRFGTSARAFPTNP